MKRTNISAAGIGGVPLALVFCAVLSAAAAPEDSLLRGKAALEDGLYSLAVEELKPVLKDPAAGQSEVKEALLLTARALMEQRRGAEILDLLNEARPWVVSAGAAPELDFWRAMGRYLQGDAPGALATLGGLAVAFPAGSEYAGRALRLTAWCAMDAGRPDEGLAAFARFDREHAASPEASRNLLEWGQALVRQGRMAEASEVLGRFVSGRMNGRLANEGRLLLGRVLCEMGQPAGAEEALAPLADASAAVSTQMQGEAHMIMARARDASGNEKGAIESARRALAIVQDPQTKRAASLLLGEMLVRAGEPEEGIPLVKAFVVSAPEDPASAAAQRRLADRLLEQGRNDQAIAEYRSFEEAFPADPDLGGVASCKGWAYFRTGRYAEAAESFGKAAEVLTNAADRAANRFKVADSLFAAGRHELAMKTYESVAADPAAAELAPKALLQAGECSMRLGNRAGAIEIFGKLARDFPDSAEATDGRLRTGEALRQERRWAEAMDAYKDVMLAGTNNARYAEALHGLGIVRYQLFQFSDALRDFEEVWTRFPSNAAAEQAFYMRGMCAYWLGDDERALSIWDQFTGMFPTSEWAPDVHFWKARFRFNSGDYAGAQKDFVTFADLYPRHQMADDALLWAGRAAAKAKEFVKANELLTRMVGSYPASDKIAEARYVQADALWELGRYPEAILIFDEIIGKYPNSELIPHAWGRKGDCQFTLGAEDPKRYAESMESYKAVTGRADAPPDLVLQAEYKTGRCLEKLGRTDDAFKQYYMNVIVKFLARREKGVWQNDSAKLWFTRAAFNAVDILESRQEWGKAARVLERVIETGVPAAPEARERLDRIKAERWWLFR